jgi:hypothetical protein
MLQPDLPDKLAYRDISELFQPSEHMQKQLLKAEKSQEISTEYKSQLF